MKEMIKKRQYAFTNDTYQKLVILAESQRRNLSACLACIIEEAYKKMEAENAKFME
jgi:hypothetical protein